MRYWQERGRAVEERGSGGDGGSPEKKTIIRLTSALEDLVDLGLIEQLWVIGLRALLRGWKGVGEQVRESGAGAVPTCRVQVGHNKGPSLVASSDLPA